MFTFKRRRNNTKNKEALESFTIMKVVSKNTRMFQKRKMAHIEHFEMIHYVIMYQIIKNGFDSLENV